MRRAGRAGQPPFGWQVAFARAATALGWMSLGASAAGALAIGVLAIRALAIRGGRIERLEIRKLEVGRLRARELVVEQEERGPREGVAAGAEPQPGGAGPSPATPG